jgi:hypothetical protein
MLALRTAVQQVEELPLPDAGWSVWRLHPHLLLIIDTDPDSERPYGNAAMLYGRPLGSWNRCLRCAISDAAHTDEDGLNFGLINNVLLESDLMLAKTIHELSAGRDIDSYCFPSDPTLQFSKLAIDWGKETVTRSGWEQNGTGLAFERYSMYLFMNHVHVGCYDMELTARSALDSTFSKLRLLCLEMASEYHHPLDTDEARRDATSRLHGAIQCMKYDNPDLIEKARLNE